MATLSQGEHREHRRHPISAYEDIGALRRAVAFRDPATGPTAGVIFHADRGCQYTSEQLALVAQELDVRQSVGRTGVCLLTGYSGPLRPAGRSSAAIGVVDFAA